MQQPTKKSRFSFQQKGALGNVAPPNFKSANHSAPALYAGSYNINPSASTERKSDVRVKDYFDDDDDDEPLSATHSAAVNATSTGAADTDDYDPLDDFMAGIQQEVSKQAQSTEPVIRPEIVSGSGGNFDSDSEVENQQGYVNYNDSDDDTPTTTTITAGATDEKQKTRIEPLSAVDHSSIVYPAFRKNFLTDHPKVSGMTPEEVIELREQLDIHVTPTTTTPRPVRTFSQLNFDRQLLDEIASAGYITPTPIQAQTIPVVLAGHDVIALAKTGSGKTLAYIWPIIVHILAQPQMQTGDGPIALVLAPTRELAAQIHTEAQKFATKVYNIRTVAIYGGGGKYEMSKALKEQVPELVVATPGRLIEMVRNKSTNLRRCTLVVLDEADRMFELGFEYQMRSIVNAIRPDKQVLMFSATMKRKIETFAREILKNEIKIVVGRLGQSNTDIQQQVQLFTQPDEKLIWLKKNIDLFAADGKVLIFVLSKIDTEMITEQLKAYFRYRQLEISIDFLHGDIEQTCRTHIIQRFSRVLEHSHSLHILVATDIASRGLDVKNVRTVINYDIAKNIETYVHRIGRTGRMGIEGVAPGTAYTLLTPKDSSFAVDLVQNLNLSRQGVSTGLLQLAQSDPKWQRVKHIPPGGGSGSSAGRGGLGYGDVGIQKGRASTAVTSAMLANGALKASTSSRFTSNRSAGESESVHTGATHIPAAAVSAVSVSSLPAGLQHRFRSATATNSGSCTETSGSSNTTATTTHTLQVSPPIPPAAANTDYTTNPYKAGHSHGRGRHLTQPAWMLSANSTTTAPPGTVFSLGATHSTQAHIRTTTTAAHQFIDTASAASAIPLHSISSSSNSSSIEASAGRRSRFAPSSSSGSNSDSATTGLNSTTIDSHNMNTTTTATATSGTTTTNTADTANEPAHVRKRSRWDT